jgi:hypothetical protein
MHVKMQPFYYEGLGGCKSYCGLEVIGTGIDSATVILTEIPGNPGTPVGDFFAELATIIYKGRLVFLKVVPESIVWIERHPAGDTDGRSDTGQHVEQVMMQWDGKRFHSPVRVAIPRETWLLLQLG